MNKVNKLITRVFILVAILVLPIWIISAENLTINETIITTETEKEEAICEEQLEIAIEEYNSLLEDFREGINCGEVAVFNRDLNAMLAEERDSCREEIGKIKVYRVGFFILFGVLIITGIIILFSGMRKGQ